MELFRPLWESLLVFAGLLSIGWILRKFTFRMNRKLQESAKDWPYVYGKIEHAEPEMIGKGETAYWAGRLSYSYTVDGEYYSGFFHFEAANEKKAWEAVLGWKNRTVIVHYLPDNPQKSILIMDEQNQPPKLLEY